MEEKMRLAVGIIGNAASLLLFAAPILTFVRVVKKRNTEEFSCVPYLISLFSCFIYTWYGLPIVSYGWENFTLVTINGLGILLELSFVLMYLWFSTNKGKMKAIAILIPIIAVFSSAVAISTFVFHDHHHRKLFVGSVGLVGAVAMYGSPLVVVKKVVTTKSVEFMPFYLSFFSFLASTLWMTYGLLSHDFFLSAPNMIGSPLGILQLLVYCKYRKKEITQEDPNKWDIESNDDKAKELKPVTNGQIINCNAKT